MGIHFSNVDFKYYKKSPVNTLDNITLSIDGENEFVAILGHTGSGKSTLVQHMNSLILPTSGKIQIFDSVIGNKTKVKFKPIRKKVGLVFQFPEYQLFEDTVIKDVMFGPLNFGKDKEEALKLAKNALSLVGIDESIQDKSPFALSGGQMRRVAIAGVLASEPDILILDEPTVGLDPKGKIELMNLLCKIQKETKKSIVMVTHDMDIVCSYVKRVIVMQKGQLVFDGSTKDLFNDEEKLLSFNLDYSTVSKYAKNLKESGLISYKSIPLNKQELIELILKGEQHE